MNGCDGGILLHEDWMPELPPVPRLCGMFGILGTAVGPYYYWLVIHDRNKDEIKVKYLRLIFGIRDYII